MSSYVSFSPSPTVALSHVDGTLRRLRSARLLGLLLALVVLLLVCSLLVLGDRRAPGEETPLLSR